MLFHTGVCVYIYIIYIYIYIYIIYIHTPINVIHVLTEQVENGGAHLLSTLFSLHTISLSDTEGSPSRRARLGDFEWNLISLPAREYIKKKESERERERERERESR